MRWRSCWAWSEAQACGRFLDVVRHALEHGDGRLLVLAMLRSEYLGEVQLLPFLTTPGALHREQTLDLVPLDRTAAITVVSPAGAGGKDHIHPVVTGLECIGRETTRSIDKHTVTPAFPVS
jgi:hypothetical protein